MNFRSGNKKSGYKDIPTISARISYMGNNFNIETGKKIFQILEKYGFANVRKMIVDQRRCNKATQREILISVKTEFNENCFANAYCDRRTAGIYLLKKESDIEGCEIDIYNTRNNIGTERVIHNCNYICINSTHGRLENPDNHDSFLKCTKELIEVSNALSVDVDDISNELVLYQKYRVKHSLNEVNTVYWGNYFDEELCNKYGFEKIITLSAYHVERIGNGMFFALTNSVLDYDSKEAKANRKAIMKKLNIRPGKRQFTFLKHWITVNSRV